MSNIGEHERFGWTTGNDSSIVHNRVIGVGCSGEVHEVRSLSPKNLLTYRLVTEYSKWRGADAIFGLIPNVFRRANQDYYRYLRENRSEHLGTLRCRM